MNPTVSILIPCFNAERFVGDAIRSALEQTYDRVEVIVIDDGSTDGSLDTIRSFGGRVRWEAGPNRGACAARNRGLELATGELVQFLDADDLLHPEKLELQVREFCRVFGQDADGATRQVGQETADSDRSNCPGMVFCDCQVSEGGRAVGEYARAFVDRDDPVSFVLGGPLGTPQPIHWRANLLAVGGFLETLPCAQERDLHVRLACHGVRFHHLAQALCTARRVPDSVSSDSVRVLCQHASIAQRGLSLLRERAALTDERARAFAAWIAADARLLVRHGLHEEASAYFEFAMKTHPSGGIEDAYRGPARALRRVLGPVWVERLVQVKRRLSILKTELV